MPPDLSDVQRHPFEAADHGQGPQAGDTQLTSGGTLPFLMGVTVPRGRELVFLSGHTPPVIDPTAPPESIRAFGDTYRQAVGALQELQQSLERLGLTMSHVVKLQVFLVGDPALGGRMDNEGFSRAYAEFFGTPAQPHLVARTRVQVVGLVNPGWLVEVDAVAVR
jgi:enamine deaminase RidA (YjgF/YER057c/UK114 family)